MKNIIAHPEELRVITDSIRKEKKGSIPQCFYIVGEIGVGKTTFLQQIADIFSSNKTYKTIYMNCLLVPMRNMDDMKKMIDYDPDKRFILLMDDFDFALAKWGGNDMSALRALIYEEDAPIMVASGKYIIPQLTDYKEPLFDSLSIITIGSISLNKTMDIIKAAYEINTKQKKLIEEAFDLIGGTPLVASLIATTLTTCPQTSTMLINGVLNQLSAYYKNLLANLSLTQRTIIISLANKTEGLSMPELRKVTNIGNGPLSSHLAALKEAMLIGVYKDKPKNSRYFIKNYCCPIKQRIANK